MGLHHEPRWLALAVVLAAGCSIVSNPLDAKKPQGEGGSAAVVGSSSSSGAGGSDDDPTCPKGLSSCGGECVDVTSDPAHCGACDALCDAPGVCYDSVCSCPEGALDCDGDCAFPAIDPDHCGGCGMACSAPANAEPTCQGAACGWECSAGYDDCNEQVDDGCETAVGSDLSNCGACGTVCPLVANGTRMCEEGACGVACNSGWGDCDGQLGTGCETNLLSSSAHCGACGVACGAGQSCFQGSCQ